MHANTPRAPSGHVRIYRAQESRVPSRQKVWHGCTQGARARHFFAKGGKHAFCNMFRTGASFSLANIYIYMYICFYIYQKFQIRRWDQNSNDNVLTINPRFRTPISKTPPDSQYLRINRHRLNSVSAPKAQLGQNKKKRKKL